METQEVVYRQLDFFHLLPGSAGGRALRALRGDDYFADLARAAAAHRSEEERQELSRKRADTRRRRLYTLPRTVRFMQAGCIIIERIVPYWPHQKNRQRRKRPIFVHIELDCVPLNN